LHAACELPGIRKARKIPIKQASLFFGNFSGFFLCALRTAGLAPPACPEAVGALLLQVAVAAFTALKEGFLLLF